MRRVVPVLALVLLSACGTAGPEPGKGGESAPVTAGPTTGGSGDSGAYCKQVKADAPVLARLIGQAFATSSSPAQVKAAFDEMVRRQDTEAALAPHELAGDYVVLNEDLRRARDATGKAGWTPQAARKAMEDSIGSDRHGTAAGAVASYSDAHCPPHE